MWGKVNCDLIENICKIVCTIKKANDRVSRNFIRHVKEWPIKMFCRHYDIDTRHKQKNKGNYMRKKQIRTVHLRRQFSLSLKQIICILNTLILMWKLYSSLYWTPLSVSHIQKLHTKCIRIPSFIYVIFFLLISRYSKSKRTSSFT